jgi:hypothetical protein
LTGFGIVLACMVMCAGVASAFPDTPAPGTILAPGPGEVVAAGQEVDVRWVPLGPAVDEFEILLSLDDGRSFPIRLTEMMEPTLVTLRWVVPNLPSASARLRIRFGDNREEREAPIGAAFRIVGERADPVARLTYRDGEWWAARVVPVYPPAVEAAESRVCRQAPDDWTSKVVAVGPRLEPLAATRTAAVALTVVATRATCDSVTPAMSAEPANVPQRE